MNEPHSLESDSPLFCDRCLVELHPGKGNFFVVKIEAVADPSPPEVSEEDLVRDHGREYKRMIEALWELSPQEAMDQVMRRVTIFLCNACYASWIEEPVGGAVNDE